MIDSLDWFTRFFTYSSIQVKFIASFVAILSFIVLRKLFLKILFKNTSNAGWGKLIGDNKLKTIKSVFLPTVWSFDQTLDTSYIFTEFL